MRSAWPPVSSSVRASCIRPARRPRSLRIRRVPADHVRSRRRPPGTAREIHIWGGEDGPGPWRLSGAVESQASGAARASGTGRRVRLGKAAGGHSGGSRPLSGRRSCTPHIRPVAAGWRPGVAACSLHSRTALTAARPALAELSPNRGDAVEAAKEEGELERTQSDARERSSAEAPPGRALTFPCERRENVPAYPSHATTKFRVFISEYSCTARRVTLRT